MSPACSSRPKSPRFAARSRLSKVLLPQPPPLREQREPKSATAATAIGNEAAPGGGGEVKPNSGPPLQL